MALTEVIQEAGRRRAQRAGQHRREEGEEEEARLEAGGGAERAPMKHEHEADCAAEHGVEGGTLLL